MPRSAGSTALQDLAGIMGVLPRWRDLSGREHVTGPETQRALLTAMGLSVETETAAAATLKTRQDEEAKRRIPKELVLNAGERTAIPLTAPVKWHLELEQGEVLSGDGEDRIVITPPPGLHRLHVGDQTGLVISAPRRAPSVQDVVGPQGDRGRAWGVTAALYGLRSARNLGLGDYDDLAVAAAQLARRGADFIGINPLHARGAASDDISPYAPSCRTAFEPRHIALDAVPGFDDCSEARQLIDANADRLAQARAGTLADYATHDTIQSPALRALFQAFRSAAQEAATDHAAWRKDRGAALAGFALFEALSLRHGADWRRWPGALQDSKGSAAGDFAVENGGEIAFHTWLQWLADRQLGRAQAAAKGAGMRFGLYLDLAVGVRPGGADTWTAPSCFAEGVSLGAPPDAFNPGGQVWNLAPFNPMGLRAAAYQPFIAMLRSAMHHAGIIRIDHILGINRSFWVPENGCDGGYVAYPMETLLALIRLEARRSGCIVVGEDLGSVPDGLRDHLAEAGLLGCAVMQFEKKDGRFRPPADYRPATLASFGTHDTPTLRGWWSGWDIDLRHDLAQSRSAARQAEQQKRSLDRSALAGLLVQEGLLPGDIDPAAPPLEANDAIAAALHGLLSSAQSGLIAVQLDDALGVVEQQNLPGTVTEYPNWRRRYPIGVDRLAEDEGLAGIAETLAPASPEDPVKKENQPWL
ncbi:4-alpha-glucanotransferase [Pelagibius litoralis]|uniref:4-alpha-glucanotransferase n=1 Tax=Pelagibius litoralis TaxID=374515 RepID=A0A967KCZ4_9PROT|nr:4-alpha-glucanotransferase [Pelagibius litoralis]NIA69945.1 4-alpha-glucanotransferase [Pelagibius litoralis]